MVIRNSLSTTYIRNKNDDDAIQNNEITDVVQMDNAGSHDAEYDRGFESLSSPNNMPRVPTHIYFNSSSSEDNESDKFESAHATEIDNHKSPSETEPVKCSHPLILFIMYPTQGRHPLTRNHRLILHHLMD